MKTSRLGLIVAGAFALMVCLLPACSRYDCVPKCSEKCCGTDDCGGQCEDNCASSATCNPDSCLCEPCQADCAGRECGADGCGGTCGPACGSNSNCDAQTGQCTCDFVDCVGACCAAGQVCHQEACCSPNCTFAECGDDRCGTSCPPGCSPGETCRPDTRQCGPALRNTGETCTDSSECVTSWCLKYTGEATGYCSARDCQGDDSCVNHGDDGAEMCCVDVGGAYFICLKIVPGYACGTQDGMCGGPCAGQLDSACDPTQACLMADIEDPNAVCAHECTTNANCADCINPPNPSTVFTCQAISGGVTYCLAESDDSCDSSLDCENLDVCIPWPTADEQSLEGRCNKLGDLPSGAECDENADPNNLPASQRCAGFYCMNNHCSEVCTLETDCPEQMVCSTINFRMDDVGDVIASIGMCLWMGGSGTACAGNSDCPAGEICDYYLPPGGSIEKVCTDWRCDPAGPACAGPGDPCGGGMGPCFTGLCLVSAGSPDGWCSALCDVQADCPAGMTCGLLGINETETTGACVQ